MAGVEEEYTLDGSVDFHGQPAIRDKSGRWFAGRIILLNQGLATLAFFGVGVNLVLFLTRVLQQDNFSAANNVSKWTGTVYIFSVVGAFLSDSYWGRYKTCALFQGIFVVGLVSFSLTTHSLLSTQGCGEQTTKCSSHTSWQTGLFYISIYMIALGYGGYQPLIATFGADQFDKEDHNEGLSKVTFFSYFYLALNLGSLFSNTVLVYFEDAGYWALGFWASAGSAFAALVLFLSGTKRYRHFNPSGNPLSRVCQVIVAATQKGRAELPDGEENFYEVSDNESSKSTGGRTLRTDGFKFLDRAAFITLRDLEDQEQGQYSTWRLCPISQVEEIKCILRLLPIWLCTIIYSVVFTQMASMFVVQGAAMHCTISDFHIPPASMSIFDILSVALVIFLYRRVLDPTVRRFKESALTELERMGIGFAIALSSMVTAGIIELCRVKYATKGGSSTLSIFWQAPQYALMGASEVFMYVGQLEFFNAQAPDGMKSFGSALCMTSIAFGNYISSLLVTIVMKVSTVGHKPGWIPNNLNKGHLHMFFFFLAILTTLDLVVYVACAKWYTSNKKISLAM